MASFYLRAVGVGDCLAKPPSSNALVYVLHLTFNM